MHKGNDIPVVFEADTVSTALLEITEKKLGMTAVKDSSGALTGIFTDGDLRRMLEDNIDVHTATIKQVMTTGGATINSEQLAVEAVKLMQDKKINALLVTDATGSLAGALNMHDLLKAGLS
jgi:arabinose-5-phosphate isomerase